MKRSRERMKGRRNGGSFAAIPHSILESSEYAALSPRAVKLLLDVFGQHNGRNNGDLAAAPSMMLKRGWRSNSMLTSAITELLKTGFFVQTRVGGLNHAALYGVTWLGINECDGKLEQRPGAGAPLQLWKSANRPQVELYRLARGPNRRSANASPPAVKPIPPAGQSSEGRATSIPVSGAVMPLSATFPTPPAGTFLHLRHRHTDHRPRSAFVESC